MPTAVEAITLDLDDTLWPIDRVIERAEAVLHAWLERHAPGVAQSLPPPSFAAYRRLLARELPAIAHDYTALRLEALRRALREHGGDPVLAEPAMEVFLSAFPRVDRGIQVSTDGGTQPVWNPRGRELFYRTGTKMMSVSVETTPKLSLGAPRVLFDLRYAFGSGITIPNYDISPDGKTFVMVRRSPAARIVVIQNLPALVRRLRGERPPT